MSAALARFIEDLVLDPVRYRRFHNHPERELTAAGLPPEHCRAIVSGDVRSVTRALSEGPGPDSLQGADAVLVR